ncbi:MAG: GEVED domain-containing protein, partial [Thermoanaerobaculia bacterium]
MKRRENETRVSTRETSSLPIARFRRWALATALLAILPGASLGQTPTVDGLFFGLGDNTLYQPYATSVNGSVLYIYYDGSTNTMYVALVVSHTVNDNVCSPKGNKDYTASAIPPWTQHRSCKRASDSEFASFTLECAPGSPRSWAWQQATGCALTAGPPQSDWVSDPTCGASSPLADWPPGVEDNSATSFVANINTYQDAVPDTRAWDLYAFGDDINDWKSPFVASDPDDVTLVPGYPTYSDDDGNPMPLFFEWEWSSVYEWSVDLGPGGTDCGDNVIVFITGNSHHSPGKHGSENDPFDPPTGDTNFSDFGDLPEGPGLFYNTTVAAGGARHYIKVDTPYLGQELQAETDGVPTADASGDGPEEDGVTANVTGNWTAGSTQTFDVVVSRAPAGGATLGAWFDWNDDGDFTDPGEFVSWTGLGTGTHTLSITVGDGFDGQSDQLYARFRVFSSGDRAPGLSLDSGDFSGTALDGEVEDYRFAPGFLPVTLNAFESVGGPGGEIVVKWQTASETDNVAFELWGLVSGEWQPVSEMIESKGMNSALPKNYELSLIAPEGLTALRLVDFDTRGRTEQFGSYRLDTIYGEWQSDEPIDWSGPRAEREERLRSRGFVDTRRGGSTKVADGKGSASQAVNRWKKVREDGPVWGAADRSHGVSATEVEVTTRRTATSGSFAAGSTAASTTVLVTSAGLTHLAVDETGIQRVTYEELRDGGLDLVGVASSDITLTWRGEGVQRWIDGHGAFGPGSAIEFLGRAPAGDDALYIDANLYQVAVDPTRALEADRVGGGKARSLSAVYERETWTDRPVEYRSQSPTGDPWVEAAPTIFSTRTVTLDLPIDDPVAAGRNYLMVHLGAITDLPDLPNIPEHNVEIFLRGPAASGFSLVTTASTSGNRNWMIEAELPAGELQSGINQVKLVFSSPPQYFFSLVVVDRIGARYNTPYLGPRLDFAQDTRARGYRIEGFAGSGVVAYAELADGLLTRMTPSVSPSGPGFAAELRALDATRFWVTESPHQPAVFTTEAPGDLLASPADLVVIAESSFVGTTALDDYLVQRAAFDPLVIDLEDLYNSVGFGMALPSAITDYLQARDAIHPFSHVQLV